MLRLITVILVAVSASASIVVPKKLCTDHKPGQGKGGCDVVDTCKHGGAACYVVAKSFLVASGADIAIQDAGSCETSFDAGTIDDTDIQLMLPHFDKLHVIELTGANVLSLISYVTRLKLTKAYPYGAGIRFDINMTAPGMDHLQNVEVNPGLSGTWTPINDATVYKVVTNEYISLGYNGYTTFTNAAITNTKLNIFNNQALLDYANTNGELVDLPTSEYSTKSYIQPDGTSACPETCPCNTQCGEDCPSISTDATQDNSSSMEAKIGIAVSASAFAGALLWKYGRRITSRINLASKQANHLDMRV